MSYWYTPSDVLNAAIVNVLHNNVMLTHLFITLVLFALNFT